jgi:uncharacterized damage-inducible protein DinB
MNVNDLRLLLDYHYWARDRVLAAAGPLTLEQYTRDLGSSFRSVRDTLVHTYSAEWIWHSRWRGHSPTTPLDVQDFPDVPALARAWAATERDVRGFVEELGADGPERRFAYRLMSGQEGSSLFWHMVQHVANHASYHRGQVTTMIRQLGAAPPKSMDLITFHRERDQAPPG